MNFRGEEFSTGEMGNFHPALTVRRKVVLVPIRHHQNDLEFLKLRFGTGGR
jgi:hypothetical protein